jgi:hypothetical protein
MLKPFQMLGKKIKQAGTQGSLRRAEGVKKGQNIPTERLISQRNALRMIKNKTPDQTHRLRQINEALTFRHAN